jgi:hypothetical protein
MTNKQTNKHNYFTNYHTPACFETIVSSSESLWSVPCQVTQVFQMQLFVIQFTIKMFHIRFMQVLILQSLKSQYYKIFKTLKLSYLQLHRPKSFCCYNSPEVSQCVGLIYNLYVDATVVPARYVLSLSVCRAVWRVSLCTVHVLK